MAGLMDLLAPPRNPARLPPSIESSLIEMLAGPVQQAGQALRGELTEPEAQDFFAAAAMGMVPMRRAVEPLAQGVKAAAKGIRAYHGSPHDFDRFDMSRIGTGEGAQAYGHGLYFAEKEGTARSYRDALTRDTDPRLEGTQMRIPKWAANSLEAGRNPDELVDDFRGRIAERRERAKTASDPWNYGTEHLEEIVRAIEAYKGGARFAPSGRMYEVNINAHPDQFLDWDKPLSEQSESVKAGLKRMLVSDRELAARQLRAAGDETGAREIELATQDQLFDEVASLPASSFLQSEKPEAFSAKLRDPGIPGIKYLDQGSRSAGEGSRNYVVFDDKLIDIIRKYGLAGVAPMGGLAAMFAPQDRQ